MISLSEECVVVRNGASDILQGLFEVPEQVSYIEISCPSGSWKGYVPLSNEIFTFDKGALYAASGRKIPQFKRTASSPRWTYLLLALMGLLLIIFFAKKFA